MFRHFTEIANQVDIPQIIYNVPSRTASNIDVNTIKRLCSNPNIIGVKDATGDLKVFDEIKNKCIEEIESDNFSLFSGDDETSFEFISRGGHGTISVTSNILPNMIAKMCEAASNNSDDLQEIKKRLEKINKLLFVESNPIPVKFALKNMGLIDEGIRLPLTWLDHKFHHEIKEELNKLVLI